MTAPTASPLFVLIALIHLAGVVSRYDAIAVYLPANSASAVLIAQIALLFVAGFFEGKINYGKVPRSGPLWMRIRSRPVKLAFSFALLYIAIVTLQTWDVQIGPIDPTPPAEWPPVTRARWFATMCLTALFPSYLLAASFLIPALRFVTRPLRTLPGGLGLMLALGVGIGAGFGVRALVRSSQVADTIASSNAWIEDNPAMLVAMIFASTLIPIVLGLILDRSRDTTSKDTPR